MNNVKGKEDFYKRHGITIRDVRNLGTVLGLPISTNFIFLASLAVTLKTKM